MSSESHKGRRWYLVGGVLSVVVGALAMARPGFATTAITDVIGFLCLASGVILMVSGFFGKSERHRILDFFSALLRVAVGILLILKAVRGEEALTILLAAIFLAEAIFGAAWAFRMRHHGRVWIWILANAIAAAAIAVILLVGLPADSQFVIGLLFGLNALILGASLIAFGLSSAHSRE